MNTVAICPRCRDRVLEGKNDYYCRSVDCNFRIGGVILGQTIHQTQVAKLLNTGRSDLLDGFISKAGKTFSAYLVINKDFKIEFAFPDQKRETECEPENIKFRGPETVECKPLMNAASRSLYPIHLLYATLMVTDADRDEIFNDLKIDKKCLRELAKGEVLAKSAKSGSMKTNTPSNWN